MYWENEKMLLINTWRLFCCFHGKGLVLLFFSCLFAVDSRSWCQWQPLANHSAKHHLSQKCQGSLSFWPSNVHFSGLTAGITGHVVASCYHHNDWHWFCTLLLLVVVYCIKDTFIFIMKVIDDCIHGVAWNFIHDCLQWYLCFFYFYIFFLSK